MQKYGESLKYQREVAGLNQPELAKKIGTSQTNVSRWERGIVLPSIDFCVKLANFYGISVDELVGISDSFGTPTAGAMGDGMTSEERELLSLFRELSPYLKGMTLNAVRSWAKNDGDSTRKKV